MNFQEVEKLRVELASSLSNTFGRSKLFNICSFYTAILSTKNNNIIEAFSLDFIDEYLSELKIYTPFYQPTDKTELLLSQLKELRLIPTLSQFEKEFDDVTVSIKNQLDLLNSILEGNTSKASSKSLRFPLIESPSDSINSTSFGCLESINIKIHKTKNNNRFVFVPSGSKIEERLLNQAKISLEIALNYLSKHRHKFHKYHEVLIYFENLSANYEGNSLGVALTIGFIEQLSLLYNLPYITNVTNNLATTGGVNDSGNIGQVGKGIIEKKIEVVFYSDINKLVIPKEDEDTANEILIKLLNQYPNRKLSIIPIANINDFINRRDLVDIKKQSGIIRTSRSIRRNWIASTLFLFLVIILIMIYVRDFDDNPEYIEAKNQTMFVKNKSGKTLWTKSVAFALKENHDTNKPAHTLYYSIMDIDEDGNNEIIVAQELFPDSLSDCLGRIACFDKNNSIVWEYQFKDSVKTKYQSLEPVYNSKLIGVIDDSGRKVVLGIANNGPNFPSAIFKIDARNGKRLAGTLWNPGHIMMGILRKKAEGKIEIVCNMTNNSYEKTGIFSVAYNKLEGTTPFQNDKYKLVGQKLAHLNYYILLPNTDYNRYYKFRNTSMSETIREQKKFNAVTFATYENDTDESHSIGYEVDNETYEINVVINSTFRVRRDSLVAHGKLKPPYTDTPEYKALLKSQVLFWNGKKFVKKNELK